VSENVSKKDKVTYCYKLFRVKRSDGRVTTISMDPVLAIRAASAMGGFGTVGKLVRQAALRYEDGTHGSCSGYVSQQVREALAVAKREKAAATVCPPVLA